jgi:hypothetical protein
MAVGQRSGPAGAVTPRSPAHRKVGTLAVDSREFSAHAHPSTEDHDDTVEAHYACLERPHTCNDGWVTLGQIVVDPQTGEETEEFALYLCRRCSDDGLR